MIIAILGSQNNKREQDWLSHWTYEFERIGSEVLVNPKVASLATADALVLLSDGRISEPDIYLSLGYFYHLKEQEQRSPKRLIVAFNETGNFPASLELYFDHITSTEKGLINTLKDYLYFSNKNVQSQSHN